MAIKIAFLSEVKDFLRGAKQSEDALGDVADALDDVAREAAKGGNKTTDELGDVGKSVDKLERKFDDLAATAKDTSRAGAKGMGDSYRNGAQQASESMQEVKQEAKQNLAETLSSFDGSAESFADGLQGTFGGLVSSLGPVGFAVAAAAAIGFGAWRAEQERTEEKAQELRDKVGELTGELIDAGDSAGPSLGYIVDKLRDMATETDANKDSLVKLQKQTESSVSGFEKIAQAYAGNKEGLDQLVKTEQEHLDQLVEERNSMDGRVARYATGTAQMVEDQQKTVDGLKQVQKAAEEAEAGEKAYLESGAAEAAAKAQQIDQINDSYDELASSASDFLNAEKTAVDPAAYIAGMEERRKSLEDLQFWYASGGLSPEAVSYLQSMGGDSAVQMMNGYRAATPEQRRVMENIWKTAAADNSGQYVANVSKGINDNLGNKTATMKLAADVRQANAAVDRFLADASGHVVTVTVIGKDRYGRAII